MNKNIRLITTLILIVATIWLFIKIPFHESYPFLIVSAMISTYMYSKKKSKPRYVLQLSALFIICYTPIIIALRGYCSLHLAVLMGFPLMALLSWVLTYIYRKYIPLKIISLTLVLSVAALEIPIRIMRFSSTLGSLPTFLFVVAGIVIGYQLFRKPGFKNWLLASIAMGFSIWVYYDGYNMWLNKLNFGTYTGQVHKEMPQDYSFKDEKGNTVLLSQMQGKIVLLDFWSARCGVCWDKFPKVQELFDNYQTTEKVIVSGVFIEYKEQEWEDNIEEFKNKYSFSTYRISKDNPLVTNLPITVFPTVAVFDQKGVLKYLGNIEGASQQLINLTEEK